MLKHGYDQIDSLRACAERESWHTLWEAVDLHTMQPVTVEVGQSSNEWISLPLSCSLDGHGLCISNQLYHSAISLKDKTDVNCRYISCQRENVIIYQSEI